MVHINTDGLPDDAKAILFSILVKDIDLPRIYLAASFIDSYFKAKKDWPGAIGLAEVIFGNDCFSPNCHGKLTWFTYRQSNYRQGSYDCLCNKCHAVTRL